MRNRKHQSLARRKLKSRICLSCACVISEFFFFFLLESLLQNRSSFLHGRKPAGNVPIYALVKKCIGDSVSMTITKEESTRLKGLTSSDEGIMFNKPIETNNVPGINAFAQQYKNFIIHVYTWAFYI